MEGGHAQVEEEGAEVSPHVKEREPRVESEELPYWRVKGDELWYAAYFEDFLIRYCHLMPFTIEDVKIVLI